MVVILGIISSCSQDKGTSRLAWGKYYLWSAPDSSYRILNAIPFPDKLSVEEQACYALLMTQAMYRCGHKISSDSLINIAVQYYSSQGNADDKASALLYKGYILEDLGQDNEALYAYKQAEEAVKTVKDLRIHFFDIYSFREYQWKVCSL